MLPKHIPITFWGPHTGILLYLRADCSFVTDFLFGLDQSGPHASLVVQFSKNKQELHINTYSLRIARGNVFQHSNLFLWTAEKNYRNQEINLSHFDNELQDAIYSLEKIQDHFFSVCSNQPHLITT
jgi:hypothetical protein